MDRAPVMLFLTLAAQIPLVLAQPPAVQPTPTQKPGRIEGNVTNSITGAGVKKASVAMNGQAHRTANTDATGHFSFDNVQPGTYFLQIECPGYSPPESGIKQFKIAEEQEIKDISLKAIPLGVIAGRVLDEDGEPLMHIQIRAMRYDYRNGRKQLNQAGFGSTNDLGQFRMIDMRPGKYLLESLPQPGLRNIAEGVISDFGNQVYAATFYPSGADVAQAAPQEVKPGEEINGVEFHMKKTASFHLRGHIAGIPAPGNDGARPVNLQSFRSGMPSNMSARVKPDGSFDVPDVVTGEYTLIAFMGNGKVMEEARTTVVVSDRDVDDLTMTLEPGVSLAGSVTIEGAPVTQPGAIQVVLEATDGPRMMGGPPATVEDDGTFQLTNLEPGTYFARVINPPLSGKYLKSIQFAGQEIPDGSIDLTHVRSGEIHIVFGSDPGQIHGTSSPSTLVTVAPITDGLIRPDQFLTRMADQNGNFQIQSLAPGKYQVMAWESNDMNSVQIPEVRKQLDGKAVHVTLEANGNESAQLTPISIADLDAAVQKLP